MNAHPSAPKETIAEIRYSLPELLEELKLDRTTGSFSMEKLDQTEITKLFETHKKRRAKKKSK
jgi:hypothetical protein